MALRSAGYLAYLLADKTGITPIPLTYILIGNGQLTQFVKFPTESGNAGTVILSADHSVWATADGAFRRNSQVSC